MDIDPRSKYPSALNHQTGFSLVEVLVAFAILLIVIVGVFQSRLNSVRRMEQSGQMNQSQDRIRQDIAFIRKAALIWQCKSGTACSGLAEDRDNPVRYDVSHCLKAKPLADFPIQSETLTSDEANIQISRVVEINDRQLEITYVDKNRGSSITASTSIVPQAMNWCG